MPAAASPQAAPVVIAQVLPAATTPSPVPAAPELPGEPRYRGRRLVVLYFDVRSMSTDDLAHVRSSAQTIVGSRIADTDLAAIMTDAGDLKVVQDFTDDRSRLIHQIESLQGSGAENTASRLSALQSAAKMLGTLPEKKALVYFGSGAMRNGTMAWGIEQGFVFQVYFGSGAMRNGTADDAQLRATIDAALHANVAFYPVDVSGLREGAFLRAEVAETVVRASAQAPYPYRLSMNGTPGQKVGPV